MWLFDLNGVVAVWDNLSFSIDLHSVFNDVATFFSLYVAIYHLNAEAPHRRTFEAIHYVNSEFVII